MRLRPILIIAGIIALGCGLRVALADEPYSFTAPLSAARLQVRLPVGILPVPAGFTREQIVHGDRIFHGEEARGQCSTCHGVDGRGTPNGNDLTTGMRIWGDGSVRMIKENLFHNMALVPGMDGDLKPEDVEAVAAYVGALGRYNQMHHE